MTLNLDHLRSFAEVIDSGSFSAAAERLGLTQPAVSLQIRQLERRLGVRLIERVARRATPTPAGTELLEHARRIEAAVEDAMHAMAGHHQGISGRVGMGTGATACIHLLPPLLGELHRAFPALEVQVSTGNTAQFVKAVEDNRLDLALVTLPVSSRNLQVTPVLEDEFVAIFAETDASSVAAAPTPEALAERPMVVFEAHTNTRQLIDDWFLQAGLRPKPTMELGSIEAIKEMVAAGLGFGIVPAMAVAARRHRRGLRVLPLQPALSRTLAIVMRQDKPLNRGLQQVVQALRSLTPPAVESL